MVIYNKIRKSDGFSRQTRERSAFHLKLYYPSNRLTLFNSENVPNKIILIHNGVWDRIYNDSKHQYQFRKRGGAREDWFMTGNCYFFGYISRDIYICIRRIRREDVHRGWWHRGGTVKLPWENRPVLFRRYAWRPKRIGGPPRRVIFR